LHVLPFTGNFLKTHTKKPPSAQEGGLHIREYPIHL
jgi:hypothetical protein